MTAWAFLPLAPADQLTQAGFDPLPDLPARLRRFVDASGAAGSLEFLARELRWIHRLSPDLAAAL